MLALSDLKSQKLSVGKSCLLNSNFGAVLSWALIPPPSYQTGSRQLEPVLREFKLWREEFGYTVNYDANFLLRPTLNLKKIQRIVI